jgi:hypothetical protein
LAVLALLAALIASQSGPAQLAHATDNPSTTVVVKPSTMSRTPADPTAWCFYDDDNDANPCSGSGQMVTGPGTAPIGTGSAAMTVGVSTGRQDILTWQFNDVALSSITTLTYQARSTSSSGNNNVFLQFNTDFGNSGGAWQGRLSFSPSTSSFTSNTWQTWDAASDTAGVWYTSKSINSDDGHNTVAPCDITTSGCTWSQVKSYWPNAKIGNPSNPGDGALLFRVGNPGGDYTGNVDAFHIVTNALDETFDFDPDNFCTMTCYVDASAVGTGDGQQESPFSTISAALSHVATNGTIHVLAGTYNEDVNIATAGVHLVATDGAAVTTFKGR